MSDAPDTKTRTLETALLSFSDRGFYGVSLDQIAGAMGLTKQALIHHFGSKERLYGTVLERVSDSVVAATQTDPGTDPQVRLERFFEAFVAHAIAHPADSRLLMRELLDDKQRADAAERWYPEPFLRDLITMVQATPRWRTAPDPQALAVAYQLLGAVSYFVVSGPTLTRMFGAPHFAEMQDIYPGELRRTIQSLLAG